MIIAVLTSQSLALNNLPVNGFDGAILILLGFGIFRGRKNGMTKEIVPTIQWVCMVAAAGLTYTLLAQVYVKSCGLKSDLAAILSYLSIAMVIFFIFSGIKKVLAPRLAGSNIFGGGEYYLGMPSGMIRYACIAIFVLAFLNAPYYSPAQIAATKAYNQRWYGGGIYDGDYLPDVHSVQETVFKKSFSGPYIKDYLGMLLIQTGPDSKGAAAPVQQAKQPVIHMGN
jgi:uncharacterized membrane protein required for colicin V production